MHWTLFSLKTPRLATCDHPVSMIDINVFDTNVDPVAFPRAGMLSAVEIRFPVSPTQGLVLSWLEGDDMIRSRSWAGLQENLNYATCRQAERQWFSRPGERVRYGEKVYPLLTQLTNPTYSLDFVTASPRRQGARDHPRQDRARPLSRSDFDRRERRSASGPSIEVTTAFA